MSSAWVAIMLAGLAAVGCATREPGSPRASAERTQAPTGLRSPSTHLTGTPSEAPKIAGSARVIVTGILLRRGDAVEVCPGQGVGPCPGIRVEGKVQDAWLSDPGKVSVWRLSGAFDGATLVLDAPAETTTLAQAPDYRNSCAEFQKPHKGGNPEPRLSARVEAFAREHPERVAGKWWDRERQTMVISVTGDPGELRRRLAERAPEARVCIQGQARFPEAELERSRAKADGILREHGVVWSSSGGDVVRNEILYEVDAIDARTLAELARDAGAGIHVVAFIEVSEHDLSQMPVPAARGNVTLVTMQTRSGARMSALGRFTVHYDAELRCVYLEASGERVLPVWPFGFWANSSPLQIFDYDDALVARAGETIELGGGQVDVEHTRTANPCGAKQAWIGYPQAPMPRRPAR